MKRTFFSFGTLLFFAVALTFVACSNEATSESGDAEPMEHTDDHAGHDHGDHDHGEAGEHPKAATDKTGPEYTSAYICPMHCEGSGDDMPGECPVCGMDYVVNKDYKVEQPEGATPDAQSDN